MRRLIPNVVLIFVLFTHSAAIARTWIIEADGSGEAPTIQAAVDSAAPGDQILLGPGTYSGAGNRNVDPGGKDLTIESGQGLGTVTIDCEGSVADTGRAFFFHSGETGSSVIRGLEIVNGWCPKGGAIRVINGAEPLIEDCNFRGNTADDPDNGGGAIFCEDTDPVIRRCLFENNRVESLYGGAIMAFRTGNSPLIEDCEFYGNEAPRGGAININSGTVRNCRFEGNRAWAGGAIRVWGSATLERCSFSQNRAEIGNGQGGGVWARVTEAVEIVECVFDRNYSVSQGGGLSHGGEDGTTLRIESCTFYGNDTGGSDPSIGLGALGAATCNVDIENSIIAFGADGFPVACAGNLVLSVTCTNVFGNLDGDWIGCLAGLDVQGNLSSDPLFCDPDFGDLTLAVNSPCAPGNHPDGEPCGLIGALSVGCSGTTATDETSWSQVKEMFR